MTPEAQRITLAEACDYFPMGRLGGNGAIFWGRKTGENDMHAPNKFTFDGLPDFLHDLNAVHEAEKMLSKYETKPANRWRYISELVQITGAESLEVYGDAFIVAHATAAQRCEALLRALGKYDDSK